MVASSAEPASAPRRSNASGGTARSRVPRIKAVAALLLGIVLVFVIVGRRQVPDDATADATSLEPTAVAPQTTSSSLPQPSFFPSRDDGRLSQTAGHLPEIDLPRVVSQNPFASDSPASLKLRPAGTLATGRVSENPPGGIHAPGDPSTFPTIVGQSGPDGTADVAVSSDSSEPQTLAVSAIVMGDGRPAALVGGRLVFENDLLDDNWRVVSIHNHGIVVEPLDP